MPFADLQSSLSPFIFAVFMSSLTLSCHCCLGFPQRHLPIGLFTFRSVLPSSSNTRPTYSSRLEFNEHFLLDFLHSTSECFSTFRILQQLYFSRGRFTFLLKISSFSTPSWVVNHVSQVYMVIIVGNLNVIFP